MPHLETLRPCLAATTCTDGLRDRPPLELHLHVVRAEPIVSAEQGLYAYAATHANAKEVSLW